MVCIVIEDQPPAQRILKKYIENTDTLSLVAIFPDALEAMIFLKSEPVDLIFLDINLPKISGIDFLKALPNAPHIILTTAFSEYAIESYELNVTDYLLKPFSYERFLKAVHKVLPNNTLNKPPKELFIKSGFEHIKIIINSISFIKSDADYTEIITEKKKYLSSEPLRHWLEVLPKNQFIRIHKSYIVNTRKIEKFTRNTVSLSNKHKLPIGRAFKEDFIAYTLKNNTL
jgi:DNA-binding LytR/AlgR family response regulator